MISLAAVGVAIGGRPSRSTLLLPSRWWTVWTPPPLLLTPRPTALPGCGMNYARWPFELVYDDQYYDPDFGAPQIRPIVGARITASGWIGIAISLVQALFAPWGIVEYTKRGGLGPEEGGFLPGGIIRNALRRALVEEPEPEPDEAEAASAEDDPE